MLKTCYILSNISYRRVSMATSKLHMWIQKNNLNIQWLNVNNRFPQYQIDRLLNDPLYKPDGSTMRIILSLVKKKDVDAKLSDFWEV
jgi:hypothetical protein